VIGQAFEHCLLLIELLESSQCLNIVWDIPIIDRQLGGNYIFGNARFDLAKRMKHLILLSKYWDFCFVK